MRRVAAVAMALVLDAGTVWAGEIDPDHFGTWAPVGQSCQSEPRIEVSAKEIVIYIHGQVQRYGDLDEAVSCNSGSAVESISTCVYANVNNSGPAPFGLLFNLQENLELMAFELIDGDPQQMPKNNLVFRRCKEQR